MSINVNLTAPTPRPPKILRLPQVVEMIGLSRSSIYRLMSLGLFPQSIRIGISAIGWIESEIGLWITERQEFGNIL